MPIDIVDVTVEPNDPDVLWGRNIDQPKQGTTIDGERLTVIGWILPKHERVVAVEAASGATVLASVPVEEERPDLSEAFPEAERAAHAGFRMTAVLGAAVDLKLELRALVEDGGHIPIGTIDASRRWVEGVAANHGPALVSVIVTCRNQANELAEAIESVATQTYPHFELVVVDDGSTDHSTQIVGRTPGARVVQLDGKGIAAARNTGFAATSGAYVVFMDASDRLLPKALEIGLRELAAGPGYAFVSGRARVVGDEPDAALYPQQPFVTYDHYTMFLQSNYVLSHASVMYRRPVLSDVGVFDTSLGELSEYELYLRIARKYAVGMHTESVVEDRQFARRSERSAGRLGDALESLRRQERFIAPDPRRQVALAVGRGRWASPLGAHDGDAAAVGVRPKHERPPRLRRFRSRGDPPAALELPAIGGVDSGDLRSLTPLSENFGFDRGQPIDRYYIEAFLGRHRADVAGRVLEVQENNYTVQFGGERVQRSDVIHLLPGNPRATIVGDLADPATLAAESFDCIILTQTLHLIFDVASAVENVARALKPRGMLLVTTPGISQVEWGESWYWSFTSLSLQRLVEDAFGHGNVSLESHGNVVAATAFLQGLAVADTSASALDFVDLSYPVIITARAVRS